MRKSIVLIWLAALGLALAVGCGDEDDLVPYFTRVDADPYCGVAPLQVQFLAFASGGDTKADPTGGNTYLDIDWDFGDGSTDKGAILFHTFDEPGEYEIVVTVKDDDGSAPPPESLFITVRSDSMYVEAAPDTTVPANTPALFRVTADLCDFDPVDGDYTRFDYLWLMDDDAGSVYTGPAPSHTYRAVDVGTHSVRLRVTDTQTTTVRWDTLTVEVTAP